MATMTTLLTSSLTSSSARISSNNLLDYHIPEAIQIQVTKADQNNIDAENSDIQHEPVLYTGTNVDSENVCTFCVDPQITSLSIVQTLVVRAFNLSSLYLLSEFQLSYYDWKSHKRLPICGDEQLNRAYLEASHPFLDIRLVIIDFPLVDLSKNNNIVSIGNNNETVLPVSSTPKVNNRSYQAILSDWDVVTSSDVILAQTITKTNNFILNQIEKIKNKARNFSSPSQPATLGAINSWFLAETIFQYIIDTTGSSTTEKVPLDDTTFRTFLDAEGRVISQRDLRITIYRRGVEPGLRKVIWKHLLNVYPEGYSGQERLDFIKIRCETYRDMRKLWQANLTTDKETAKLANMIRKDVLRTDRQHPFYASNGSAEAASGDNFEFDNENVTCLFNMLLTYALNHRHKYCQGMSDLASPLLYVMKDEAHAYISFCALMRRLGDNFSTDGVAITRKFNHLKALLQQYDLEFYNYLRLNGAHDLLFCYRWLLLDLKREFEFEETLQMLEVLWASIPPEPNDAAYLNLFDDGYLYIPNCNVEERVNEDEILKTKPSPELTTKTKPVQTKNSENSSLSIKEQLASNKLLPKENGIDCKRQNFEFTINHWTYNSQDFFVATPENLEDAEVAIEAHEEILDQMVKESGSSSSDDSSSSCSTNDSGVIGSRQLSSKITTLTAPQVTKSESAEESTLSTPKRQSKVNRRRRRRLFDGEKVEQEDDEDEDEDDEVIVFEGNTISVSNRSQSKLVAGDDDDTSEAAAILVRTFSMDSNEYRHRSRDRRTPRTASFSFARNLLSIGKSVSVDSLSSVTSGYDGKSVDSKLTNITTPINRQGSPTGSIANGLMIVGPIEIEMSELDESGRLKSVSDEVDQELETNTCKLNVHPKRQDPCLSNIFSTSTSSLVILSTVSESQIDPDANDSSVALNTLLTPDELGPSEAFMLFLCLTLLLQNRDKIIEQNMDRNDIQMCFDSMVRRHNVKSVLRDARNLFHTYLSQWHKECLHA